jgi:hypothetical protein
MVSLCLLALPQAARAQATKIFVASFGNDANDGSRGSPKRNFQAAHNAVAAGGQIVVLDTAGYGQLNISKSLRVTVPPGVNGIITTSGGVNGVNIAAGAGDTVALRGLIVEGANAGGVGVNSSSVGTLIVEDCTLRGFASGIAVDQSVAGRLRVRGGSIQAGIYGIFLQTEGTNTLNGLVVGCTIEDCGFAAIQTNGSASGSVRLSAVDCVLTANNAGFSPGSNTVIYADNCRASGNTKVVDLSGGGQAFTLGNNAFTNNFGTSDAFSGSVPER